MKIFNAILQGFTRVSESIGSAGSSFTGSFTGDGTNLTLKANVVSSSAQISTEISGAFNAASSSFSTRVYNVESKSTFTGSFTGSFIGDGTGLFGVPVTLPANVVSSSAQITYTGIINVPANIVSSSAQITYSGISSIPSGIVSSSAQITYSGISSIPSGIVSSSAQISTEISGAFNAASSSFSTRVYNVESKSTFTGSFTGSFIGDGTGLFGVPVTLPANVVSSSAQITYSGISSIPSGIVSSSAQISTEISGAFNAASSSFSTRVYNVESKSTFTGSFTGSFSGHVYVEPSASVNSTVNGIITTFRANDNHAFGDAVFINSTGSAQLGNATNVSSSLCVAMSIGSVSGNAVGSYLLVGIARNDSWNWTPGGLIFLSTSGSTSNTMTQINVTGSNNVTQILGVATHADRMIFNPQYVQVITT